MPNLLLTNICNRKCPYCFAAAQVRLGTSKPGWQMSRAELDTILSYTDPRKHPIALLGGEPTLHRHFADIAMDLLQSGYDVKVFTNGCTSALRKLPKEADGLSIVLNLNSPATYTAGEWEQIEANCRWFGPTIRLGYNIFETDFDFEYLETAITGWHLGAAVRIGLAQPILGMGNAHLGEDQLRQACKRLVRMADRLADKGISLGFDCGFRLCLFDEEELALLARCGAQLLFACDPIIDIGPDLMVWRCFPFSVKPGVHLLDYPSLDAIKDHFNALWAEQVALGNTSSCPECEAKAHKACSGGCLARTVNMNGAD